MRTRFEINSFLTDPGIIAVIRTTDPEQVLPICEALVAGGVNALEITLTVPKALVAIRSASARFGGSAVVGVGSVLSADMCRSAIEVGAQFVVSPVMKTEILDTAHGADRTTMLGCYTPTEAQLAYEAGVDFVKLFPADTLGPGYIKSLLAPLPHLRVVPTGGVTLENVGAFFKAGTSALGVGSSLITPAILRDSNWAELTNRAQAFVEAARTAKAGK